MAFDEVHGVADDGVGNVFVLPQRLSAAFHVANAADAVDNRHVVAVARSQVVEQFGVRGTGGFAVEIVLVAHRYGMLGVVIGHAPVLDKHARHAVGRGSHDVIIIKANIVERLWQRRIPVLLARLVAQS